MKILNIKNYLESIDVTVEGIELGDFDYIGKFTAEKARDKESLLYKTRCMYFRPNYERGILVYCLIRQFNLTSMLECGFGRGYTTFCAAKAFYDAGVQGTIVTIDPALSQEWLQQLAQVFPKEWFSYVKFVKDTSQNALPRIEEKFDLVYIDGDHSYQGTKFDWENTKDKCRQFMLFDDYHLKTKTDSGTIECRELIDEIDEEKEGFEEKLLIKLDRRLFPDDRGYTDDQINYGQVLMHRK
jgi:predicted O-methyltransferase YrrM